MNIKNWAKFHKKEIIVAVIFLIIGMIICPKGTGTKEVIKTEYKDTARIEYVGECEDIGIYKQIKDIDDGIILLQATGLLLASEGFYAVSEFNFEKLDKIGIKVKKLTPQIEELAEQRINLIEKLGK